ncbi:acetylcholine receptor subunit beta-like 1 [Diachasma alloeum]|uniref:acetylcholine receptor subunit beta-like 1 n=1 Tax=Diachasma alloeum TaxID=454923 RepID=UPI0007383B35|nr:acetylcholine receptor subunit beta-like 1 [Diachasma alloeum]
MYCYSKILRFLLISAVFCVGLCSEDEERLVRDLFRGYNKLIRPVQNMTEKVHVRFGLAFVQLINVNEKNQIMKSNVWLRFVWTDYQLQWDEADYGGIGVLRLPPDKVWKPDIVLFNNADGNYEVRYKSNVLIYPNGEVLWVPPAIYQSSCTIDVTYFPFDQQTCIMKFGSWTFNGDQVSLALYNDKNFVDLSDYWKSGTWDIINVPAYLNTYQNPELPTETDITFYIIIRRKTLFYTVNLILPTVLISFLCVLVFYLPAEAGEKVTLGISILLSLVVFLLLVSKILPPTSLVLPLIAKYLLFTFIMNTVSILVTVVIINWNFRGPRTHRMPQIIRKIFLKVLPTILLMRRPKKTRLRWMMEIPNVTLPASTYSGSPTELPKHLPGSIAKSKMEIMELSDLHHPNCKINRKVHHTTSTSSTAGGGNEGLGDRRGSESSDSVLLSPEATKATEAVEFIAEHLRNEDLYIQTREDWKYVAMVIDRLQLYLFFIVTTAGTIGILMDAPHIFEYVDQDRIIEIYRGK